jgi:CubicO group peptidase (beta-lactamase class C family)
MTGRILFVLLICALSATAALAQAPGELGYTDVPEMPEGIEGERIQMLFDAINESDVELAKRFHEECFSDSLKEKLSAKELVEFVERIGRQTGSIDFHSIRVYDPPREDQTVIIFWDRNYDGWKAFSFHYAEGEKPDGLLAGFDASRARTPSDAEPAGPFTEEEAIAHMWPFLNRLCEYDLFSGTVLIGKGNSGTVLIGKGNELLLAASCGEASKRFHVPVGMKTKFNIGSMNKMFTSVAIMQLVEKGMLSVDDPIGKYVDESWFPREITDVVTIHHLLTHTSGLGSYFNETFDAGSRKRWRELDDYKELIAADTLAFEPGTDWAYSNTGMFMLGVVIESVTGGSYLDECSSGWKNNLYEHVIRGGPAGGGFSTAPDLFQFARALQTGVLVSEESLETIWTDHFDAGYGYGFGVREGAAGKVVGHGGGFTGINANLDIFLDSGYIAVVMTNYDGAGSPVDAKIAEVLGRVE